MVYCPKDFKVTDPALINDLIQRYDFATLISSAGGSLEIGHLPCIYEPGDGPKGSLYVHLARANSLCKALLTDGNCIVVFKGPSSYISPHWYTQDAEDHIPTWNYAVVHAHGKAALIEDEDRVFWQMTRLHERHDPSRSLAVADHEKRDMIPHVAMFHIPVDRFEAVFKLSQNRSPEDAIGAIKALASSGDDEKKQLSEMMRQALSLRTP